MDSKNTDTQKIAYWPNGLWCDPDTAALAVEVANFPTYQVIELPINAGAQRIEIEISLLLAKQEREKQLDLSSEKDAVGA